MEPPAQRYQGVQKESAGYKLLSSMGWKEGEGLGAAKQGIKEHIRVKKKFENWGVGAVEAADRARDWSTGMAEFHRVLSTLSEITSQHATANVGGGGEGEKDESEDESDASDEGAAAAAAAAVAVAVGRAAQRSAEGAARRGAGQGAAAGSKKANASSRKEGKISEQPALAGDGSISDGVGEAEEAAPAARRVTHLGRFKKRESAKKVTNYSQTDLAAILGVDPFAAAAAAAPEVRMGATTRGSGDERATPAELPPRLNDQQAAQQQEEATADTVRERGAEEEAVEAATGQWWSDYFIRSGRMGALKRRADDPAARGFSEQDQADLYNKVQGGATQGKVGLGQSTALKKVGGARWTGKRTRLGSDSESEGEDEAAAEADARVDAESQEDQGGIVIVLPASHRQQPQPPAAAADEVALVASGAAAGLCGIRWKRAVAAVLKGSSKQRLKLERLQKAVRKQQGLHKRHSEEVARRVAACVQASARFALVDGSVQLAAR